MTDTPFLPPRDHAAEPEMAHELTKPNADVHEPIGHTVRALRRQIWLGVFLMSLLALINIGALVGVVLVLRQNAALEQWRQQGRAIQLENKAMIEDIARRVRAHDHVFEAK